MPSYVAEAILPVPATSCQILAARTRIRLAPVATVWAQFFVTGPALNPTEILVVVASRVGVDVEVSMLLVELAFVITATN